MSASKVSHLRKIELLKKEIEKKEKNLKAYKKYINRRDDEVICVLEEKKLEKEVQLKKCYWIQCTAVFCFGFFLKSFAISRLQLNQYMFLNFA